MMTFLMSAHRISYVCVFAGAGSSYPLAGIRLSTCFRASTPMGPQMGRVTLAKNMRCACHRVCHRALYFQAYIISKNMGFVQT